MEVARGVVDGDVTVLEVMSQIQTFSVLKLSLRMPYLLIRSNRFRSNAGLSSVLPRLPPLMPVAISRKRRSDISSTVENPREADRGLALTVERKATHLRVPEVEAQHLLVWWSIPTNVVLAGSSPMIWAPRYS